jgi:hypothetical protein
MGRLRSLAHRESVARTLLAAGAVLATVAVLEAGLRLAGYTPARHRSPGELYSPRERIFLDAYPTNPRGYFDIDLGDPTVRRRYEELGVRDIGPVAARAPFAVEFRYNALGFRDREVGPRRPGVRRIVVLGDSFTEGQGVKEADTTVRRLEAALVGGGGQWEVVNAARRGADFPGLYKMFERVAAYEPDLVLHAMVPNDAARSREFDARHPRLNDWILDRRSLLTGPGEEPRWRGFRLASFVSDRVESYQVARDSTQWYLDLYGAANADGWRRTRELMQDMDARMKARGGRFAVATWPLLVDLERDPLAPAEATIAAFLDGAGIPRIDLRPALRGRPVESLWVHAVDHHPNEVAHRLAAEALAPVVRRLAEER